jgi:hypothetical protein
MGRGCEWITEQVLRCCAKVRRPQQAETSPPVHPPAHKTRSRNRLRAAQPTHAAPNQPPHPPAHP